MTDGTVKNILQIPLFCVRYGGYLIMLTVFSIILSTISLLVSLYVAYLAWKFNDLSTKRASREFHAKMLFDIDKQLVAYPELWAIYDYHGISKNKDKSLVAGAKREAFIYQHLNMFDAVRDSYVNIISQNDVDAEYWHAWELYIKQFFRESMEARNLLKEKRTQEVYSEGTINYFTNMMG